MTTATTPTARFEFISRLSHDRDSVASGFSRTTWIADCSYTEVPTHGPGHLRTFDYTGLYRYFLTFCCHSGAQRFYNAPVVELVLAQILRAAADEQFAIPAYCFMPDHAHLLVEARTDSSNALHFIRRAKQLSGFHYQQRHGQRLWQR